MLKRSFDIVASFLGLIIICPILTCTALAIALKDGFPIFFKQKRVGKNGKTFYLYKFRTMVKSVDSDRRLSSQSDTRVTSLGRLLRYYKLDELPQLLNVLKGEMSFVGYRPEIPYFVEKYNESQKQILAYKPGIVDPATLKFSRFENELLANSKDVEKDYLEKILPVKLNISLNYAKNASFFKDMQYLWKCFVHLLK
jgi:Sugar transferases involved in lipopolysaccharide synthesis